MTRGVLAGPGLSGFIATNFALLRPALMPIRAGTFATGALANHPVATSAFMMSPPVTHAQYGRYLEALGPRRQVLFGEDPATNEMVLIALGESRQEIDLVKEDFISRLRQRPARPHLHLTGDVRDPLDTSEKVDNFLRSLMIYQIGDIKGSAPDELVQDVIWLEASLYAYLHGGALPPEAQMASATTNGRMGTVGPQGFSVVAPVSAPMTGAQDALRQVVSSVGAESAETLRPAGDRGSGDVAGLLNRELGLSGKAEFVPANEGMNRRGPYYVSINGNRFELPGFLDASFSEMSEGSVFGNKGDPDGMLAIGFSKGVFHMVSKNQVSSFELDLPLIDGQPVVRQSMFNTVEEMVALIRDYRSPLPQFDDPSAFEAFKDHVTSLMYNRVYDLALSAVGKAFSIGLIYDAQTRVLRSKYSEETVLLLAVLDLIILEKLGRQLEFESEFQRIARLAYGVGVVGEWALRRFVESYKVRIRQQGLI